MIRRNMKSRQSGYTILEALAALTIIASVMVWGGQFADSQNNDMRNSVTGKTTTTFGQAMQSYVKDNYAGVAAVATSTTPALIRVSTLIATGYLQAGFSGKNPYGQTLCGLVLQPSAGQLNGLVVAEGGTAINDLDLGSVAAMTTASSGAGGAIYSTSPATLTGTAGGWSTPTGNFANANNLGLHCDGSAGAPALTAGHPVMAIWFAGGDTTAGLLYRSAVPGQPQLNQMNTPLVMGSTQTVGTACATTGAIAQDGSGIVLSCQSGLWNIQGPNWQAPVVTFATLPTCNAGGAWQTRIVKTPTTGTGPRSYTCDGTTWLPLGVNDAGNLTVSGTLTVAKLAGNLQITSTATDGAACAADGMVAMSTVTSGLLLSCQSGSWASSSTSGDTWAKAFGLDPKIWPDIIVCPPYSLQLQIRGGGNVTYFFTLRNDSVSFTESNFTINYVSAEISANCHVGTTMPVLRAAGVTSS